MVMVAMVDSQVQLGHISLILVLLLVTNSTTRNGVVLIALLHASITLKEKSLLVEHPNLLQIVSNNALKNPLIIMALIKLKPKILIQYLMM